MNTNCEQARDLLNQAKFQEASECFSLLAAQSADPLEKVSYLLEVADCYRRLGRLEEAMDCLATAKTFAVADALSYAQVEFVAATVLIEQDKHEHGLKKLTSILSEYSDQLEEGEGRELYQEIQMQRGISLMYLARYENARPILQESVSFGFSDKVISDLHCHLGRCDHELGLYREAKEQFEQCRALGVNDEWQSTYHYYFGYTLYELKDFAAARRELILCLQSGASGPPQSYVYRLLAATCGKLGDREEARVYDKLARSS